MSEFPINDNQKYDAPNEDTSINAVIETIKHILSYAKLNT
jgi:hypothetical protein